MRQVQRWMQHLVYDGDKNFSTYLFILNLLTEIRTKRMNENYHIAAYP